MGSSQAPCGSSTAGNRAKVTQALVQACSPCSEPTLRHKAEFLTATFSVFVTSQNSSLLLESNIHTNPGQPTGGGDQVASCPQQQALSSPTAKRGAEENPRSLRATDGHQEQRTNLLSNAPILKECFTLNLTGGGQCPRGLRATPRIVHLLEWLNAWVSGAEETTGSWGSNLRPCSLLSHLLTPQFSFFFYLFTYLLTYFCGNLAIPRAILNTSL